MKGRKTIQFFDGNHQRKTIRLGKLSMSHAITIKAKIEALHAANVSGLPSDGETAAWVALIADDLADKLANVGLVQKRASARLGDYLDSFIAERTDVKPNTRRNLEAAKARLIECFGRDKPLRDLTAGDADAFVLWLDEKYAKSTTSRTVKRAKQFLRSGVRRRLIRENPFAEVKAHGQTNELRKRFITREEAVKVLAACPDAEWRLLIALSRFGGLRCPSENLSLR